MMMLKLAMCAFMVAAASAMSTSLPRCAAVRCRAGTTCVEVRGLGAWCKPDPYDCRTEEVWTAAKTKWCCENKGLGCEPPTCRDIDCSGPTAQCVEGTNGQGATCTYNCRTREVWTAAKAKWCCENKGLGCDPCAGVRCLAVEPVCREGEVVKIPKGECCPRCVPLELGDVCRSGGAVTGPLVDNSAFCPEHTVCRPKPDTVAIGGEVPWTCQA